MITLKYEIKKIYLKNLKFKIKDCSKSIFFPMKKKKVVSSFDGYYFDNSTCQINYKAIFVNTLTYNIYAFEM